MSRSIHLYRQLLREASHFPVAPVGRKFAFNAREVFEIHRGEQRSKEIERLHAGGQAALRVIAWLKLLPKVDFSTRAYRYINMILCATRLDVCPARHTLTNEMLLH